jgi:hypothetical protein
MPEAGSGTIRTETFWTGTADSVFTEIVIGVLLVLPAVPVNVLLGAGDCRNGMISWKVIFDTVGD